MGPCELADQGQADTHACARVVAYRGAAALLAEELEKAVHGTPRDAPAVVRHRKAGESSLRDDTNIDDSAGPGEPQGVFHEVADDLLDPDRVRAARQRVRRGDVESQADRGYGFRHGSCDARHQRAQVEWFYLEPELSNACTGNIEQVADQSSLPPHRGANVFAQFAQLLVVALRAKPPDKIGLNHHRCQRLPEFVRGDHHEPVLRRGGLEGFVARCLQPSKSAGLFLPHGPTSYDASNA